MLLAVSIIIALQSSDGNK
uniref:Uncharacterized protein n=1 Tax=Arundo donax TaxID=35708 RepID=A0A0A9FKZ8_ARUDO